MKQKKYNIIYADPSLDIPCVFPERKRQVSGDSLSHNEFRGNKRFTGGTACR